MINKKRIALIVGAGAVENAWEPVCKSFQSIGINSKIDSTTANACLARLVYNMRFTKDLDDPKPFEECKRIYENVKKEICRNIKESMDLKELRARDCLQNIVEQLIFPNLNQLLLVSTNWDTIVDDTIIPLLNNSVILNPNKVAVGHLHGTYTNPETLYLPTEVAKENYRTKDELDIFLGIHSSLVRTMAQAETIIIYGLSLSPLDAELYQLLSVCFSMGNIEEVKIVDCNPDSVAQRVTLLLPSESKINVLCFKPDDLKHS